MTEKETLERARMYMEKLAKGINPLDGTVIPEDDVVNNVQLSRCFFYVAEVLRQIIENGGAAPKKREKKTPFTLPLEARAAFAYSAMPIPVSEIAKRINDLIDTECMTKLPYHAIRGWLFSIGLIEKSVDEHGKAVMIPTAQGENLGIHLEVRAGDNGPYSVVVYTMDAQIYILDNLDAIIDYDRAKTEHQGQPWSGEDDALLAELYEKGAPMEDIAFTLKRNNSSIRSRLKKLHLMQQ